MRVLDNEPCLFTPFSLTQFQTGRENILDQEPYWTRSRARGASATTGLDLWVRTKRRRLWLLAFQRRGEGHPIRTSPGILPLDPSVDPAPVGGSHLVRENPRIPPQEKLENGDASHTSSGAPPRVEVDLNDIDPDVVQQVAVATLQP